MNDSTDRATEIDRLKRPPLGKLRAQGLASKLMTDQYIELDRASKTKERKIAWCSSVGPAELLRGMGFLVYFPENHAAMLGAGRQSCDAMQSAGREGYAKEICSYLRSDVGAFLNNTTPLSRIKKDITSPPHPDVLVYNTNQCRDIKDWFAWYGRRLGVPCIGIESPRGIDEVTADHIDMIARQIRKLVPVLEQISKKKLDMDHLRHATALSKNCGDLWKQALEKARHRPSPLSFHAALTLMGPAVTARGTQDAVDFLQVLNEELDRRILHHVPAIKSEIHRLYWEGLPIWGRVAELHRLFSSLETNIVASTYCNSWIFDALDPDCPMESMARAYTELFIARSDDAKERYISAMAKHFSVDGIVFHEAKTCPNNSNSRYGMPDRVSRALNLQVTIIVGDHTDLNLYDGERTATQIKDFIERLE